MPKKRTGDVKYEEGQWFAIPLRDYGYALGIIVRGNYETQGGLGYFFGPRYKTVPDESGVENLGPHDAILIARFGDLGIIQGRWPLIKSSRSFIRGEWPVPKFHRVDALDYSKAWLVEYSQDFSGHDQPTRETRCLSSEVKGLPYDSLSGYGAIEIKLTHLLSEPDY